MLPLILIIDDALWHSRAERKLFCEHLALRDVSPDTAKVENVEDEHLIADAYFHSGQKLSGERFNNSTDAVREVVKKHWPVEGGAPSLTDPRRWAMVFVDYQFPGRVRRGGEWEKEATRDDNEFGRRLIGDLADAFPFRRTWDGEAHTSVTDFPLFSLSTEDAATVGDATDSLGSQGFFPKPTYGSNQALDRKTLCDILFLYGLLQDGHERAVDRATGTVVRYPASAEKRPSMIGSSLAMLRTLLMARRSVQTEATAGDPARTFILGERGTGKELLVKYMHQMSRHRAERVHAVTLDTFSDEHIDANLFGADHRQFTNVQKDTVSFFVSAGRGTLFIDEIGNVDLPRLYKLLRPAGELKFLNTGQEREQAIECQMIFATNKDVDQKIADGEFPPDLVDRMTGVVSLPPLGKRLDDLPELLDHFITLTAPGFTYAKDVVENLRKHPWPGNVRELQRVVERAVKKRKFSRKIQWCDIEQELRRPKRSGVETFDELLELMSRFKFRRDTSHELENAATRFRDAATKIVVSMFDIAAQLHPDNRESSTTGGSYKKIGRLLGLGDNAKLKDCVNYVKSMIGELPEDCEVRFVKGLYRPHDEAEPLKSQGASTAPPKGKLRRNAGAGDAAGGRARFADEVPAASDESDEAG